MENEKYYFVLFCVVNISGESIYSRNDCIDCSPVQFITNINRARGLNRMGDEFALINQWPATKADFDLWRKQGDRA